MPNKKEGMCHLCGRHGPLSFEHIPLRRVFNRFPVYLHTFETVLKKYKTPRKLRQGMGRDTLCRRCNSFTADRYGDAFAEWTVQAVRYARLSSASSPISVPFEISPLNVIKQIMTMALATTDLGGPDYLTAHRRFVLFPFERHLPPEVRVFVYFNPNEHYRLSGNAAIIRRGMPNYILADIAFPPLGYCVTQCDSGRPPLAELEGLCDITWFSEFRWQEKQHRYLSIPRRTPYGPCPLAFAEMPETTVQGGTVLLARVD